MGALVFRKRTTRLHGTGYPVMGRPKRTPNTLPGAHPRPQSAIILRESAESSDREDLNRHHAPGRGFDATLTADRWEAPLTANSAIPH